MEYVYQLIDFVLHIDVHLKEMVLKYDTYTYLILGLIVYCETGLVVTPFLPGDSLLFAAGALAAAGSLNIVLLIAILFFAAFAGDNTNYAVGNFIGHKILSAKRKIIKPEYIEKTHAFYERHGGTTVVIARFMPILRTFAPFVAGLGSMIYRKFVFYSLLGNVLWIFGITLLGYAFGSHPIVQNNFSLVILLIIIASVLPMIIAILKNKLSKVTAKNKIS
ncbi:MAG: DedA family protein [Bacteroidetes bacterium]|nr:MAG: DedA family protein [Bacteroidota bacterium]REJ99920.1 MAG: DedA family protein [Bacteroidota bacterium]REK35900.1 MAG: DedA family protein [Bacteroidota bacterium]REK50623.1 MAG: DedA family protein [Bacteroidota bacterium]